MDNAEHEGVRANTQCQGDHRHGGEAGALEEHPQGIAHRVVSISSAALKAGNPSPTAAGVGPQLASCGMLPPFVRRKWPDGGLPASNADMFTVARERSSS